MTGTVGILNVGAGDTKLTFDKGNPTEMIRAARIVTDMLKRGYALLIEVEPGIFQRAHRFDEAKCEYIIADFDPTATEPTTDVDVSRLSTARRTGLDDGPMLPKPKVELPGNDHEQTQGQEEAIEQGPPEVKPKRGRPRKNERAIPASSTRAVAVARTAGG